MLGQFAEANIINAECHSVSVCVIGGSIHSSGERIVKSYLQLVLVLLVVFLMTAASAFGVNGPYGVPTEASYKGLSEKEKALYQARLAKLLHHEFVNKSHDKTASFYLHPEGVGEFTGWSTRSMRSCPSTRASFPSAVRARACSCS